MVRLLVCVGSACHLKGAYGVVGAFRELIAEHGATDQVELAAAFCLGHCTEAVTCKVGDSTFLSVNPENARCHFEASVLPLISRGGAQV